MTLCSTLAHVLSSAARHGIEQAGFECRSGSILVLIRVQVVRVCVLELGCWLSHHQDLLKGLDPRSCDTEALVGNDETTIMPSRGSCCCGRT